MLRYDLHLHTHHSFDSLASYDGIIEQVQRRGLDGIAVTDHNTMAGARALAERAPFPVILGEEIRTQEGEVIGYFMSEEIPRGLSLDETLERLRSQGAVIAVPHPVDRVRASSALGESVLRRIIDRVDLIEGFNARCMWAADNARARAIAAEYGRPLTAGSDAHHPIEIGRAWSELADFDDAQSFLAALRGGTIHGRRSQPWASVLSTAAKVAKRTGVDRWISY